jgi:hypothetical protein
METRELYKQKYQAQIHEWAAKLDVLKARAERMSAQKQLDAKPRVDAMHAGLESARAKMLDIASATDDKWEQVKKDVEHAWGETRSAVEGAYDAVMSIDEDRPKSAPASAPASTPAAAPAPSPRAAPPASKPAKSP